MDFIFRNKLHKQQFTKCKTLAEYSQGGHGTGKTGNLVLTFSTQGKHREFGSDTGKNLLTQGKLFGL